MNEFVVVFVVLGVILEIDFVILGFMVFVWGNFIGDLILNLVLVCNGGDGV